jgi:SNF2 family DNA or RNA helicase
MIQHKHPMIGLEMRLGKTLVTIRATQAWRSRRILVVAPLSVVDVWAEEIQAEGGRIIGPWAGQLGEQQWHWINYEGLLARSKRGSEIDDSFYDTVILDESTRIKSPTAQISKLCCKLFRTAKHRVCLSGLPDPEGPMDFFMQFKFLHGEFMGYDNYYHWRYKYFRQQWHDWEPKPGTREAIRAAVARSSFILSRKQAGVGGEKIYERRVVEPSAEQTRLSKLVKREFAMSDRKETKYVPVVHSWLRRIAGGHGPDWTTVGTGKIKELLSLLKGELRSQQVVVFFAFNHELAKVWQALKREGISAVWVTGKTSRAKRKERRHRFMSGRARVALLQVACVKYGINLSAATAAVYYSNSESLETRRQSEDRIVDASRREPLLYIDLITRGSVDEDVSKLLREKHTNAKFFLAKLHRSILRRLIACD